MNQKIDMRLISPYFLFLHYIMLSPEIMTNYRFSMRINVIQWTKDKIFNKMNI